jgi:hypothetical protein
MFGKKVDEVQVAKDLLNGAGLNKTAFARGVLGKEDISPKDKQATKELFDSAFELLKGKHGDSIYKDGHDYFLKEVDVEALKEEIVVLKAMNSAMTEKLTKLSGKVKDQAPERSQWLYLKGKGEMFPISKVEEKLKEGYTDHPDKR